MRQKRLDKSSWNEMNEIVQGGLYGMGDHQRNRNVRCVDVYRLNVGSVCDEGCDVMIVVDEGMTTLEPKGLARMWECTRCDRSTYGRQGVRQETTADDR